MSDFNSAPGPVPESSDAPEASPDETLAGYIAHHDRPPAFEGPDAHPYTVAIEVERTPDLGNPYVGYLVFPRWALTGVGIIGHVETPTLVKAKSTEDAQAKLGALPLPQVKAFLDQAIVDARNAATDAK